MADRKKDTSESRVLESGACRNPAERAGATFGET